MTDASPSPPTDASPTDTPNTTTSTPQATPTSDFLSLPPSPNSLKRSALPTRSIPRSNTVMSPPLPSGPSGLSRKTLPAQKPLIGNGFAGKSINFDHKKSAPPVIGEPTSTEPTDAKGDTDVKDADVTKDGAGLQNAVSQNAGTSDASDGILVPKNTLSPKEALTSDDTLAPNAAAQNAHPSKEAHTQTGSTLKGDDTKAISVWMTDELRKSVEQAMPGAHRGSLLTVAYAYHHLQMYSQPVLRPGRVSKSTGKRSRNWTVRIHMETYEDLQALAAHLRWPIASVIKKLLELEVKRITSSTAG